MRTSVLLAALFAVSTTVVEAGVYNYGYGYARGNSAGSCAGYTCGTNAKCTMTDGRPVCSCLNLHMGDPLVHCYKVECLIDDDCHPSKVCGTNNKCTDPCIGRCGVNANCEVNHHVPSCTCPPGYTGSPTVRCYEADPQASCKPNPCGPNTQCVARNNVPFCSCSPGYFGNPSVGRGCHHECESDGDCSSHLACVANFKCESPCSACGEGANCDVVNHQARCSCPSNWLGNPRTKCYPECTHHSDCPGGKPACLYQKCTNPCEGSCGINANCELRGITPVCSCPRDMTGDPFISCRPFVPEDLCQPNPCGENAICTPGHDNTGAERPVCTCPAGYFGNAIVHCKRGECVVDNDCPDNRACIENYCQNPCTGKECAVSARCEARRHIAVCTCLDGTRGDAVIGCQDITGRNGYYRSNNYRYGSYRG